MVVLVSKGREAINEYSGLHDDSKPTDCPVNSLFYELDTKDVYYFDGSSWTKVGS